MIMAPGSYAAPLRSRGSFCLAAAGMAGGGHWSLRAGRLSSGSGGLSLVGSLGAQHLEGEAAVGLAKAFGQIRRGAKSQGASMTGLLFVQMIGVSRAFRD
jgi:hypothetical protein